MKSLKDRLAFVLYPLARILIRSLPPTSLRRRIWYFILQKLAWRHLEFTIKADHGFVIRGDVAEFIHRCVYFFGTWEPAISHFVIDRLQEGDCFVDVGANVGYYSLLSARRVGKKGKVVAIEASPTIAKALSHNLYLNRVGNIRLINVAVSDRPGELSLFEASQDSRGLTTTSPTWAARSHFEYVGKVAALPLGLIIDNDELRTARIVKIDVEGAEWDVCQGLMPLLRKARKDIEVLLEVTPSELELQGHTSSQLIGQFRKEGFVPYEIENSYCDDKLLLKSKGWRARRVQDDEFDKQTDLVLSRLDKEWIP